MAERRWTDETIRIEGLRELRSVLRSVDKTLLKSIQVENKAFAQEVAGAVRSVYQGQHPARTGRGAASIRGLGSQSGAMVAIGSARTPYMLGQEFGSYGGQWAVGGSRSYVKTSGGNYAKAVLSGRGGLPMILAGKSKRITKSSMRQFPKYIPSPTGKGGSGYYLYPTLRFRLPKLRERYLQALDRAFDRMAA